MCRDAMIFTLGILAGGSPFVTAIFLNWLSSKIDGGPTSPE